MNAPRHLFALASLAGVLPAQNLLTLPDNHNLSEVQTASSGSTAYFGTAARRFQILYDASHFTNAGVTAPITLTELAFRGEDGEANKGGQNYTGITISVYQTSLNSGVALSTTFATNVLPATTTLLGTTVIASLTLPPSAATTPSNYMWQLPLIGMLPFDTASAQPNLLVDISYLTYTANIGVPPIPNTNVPAIQDTTGTAAQIRGRALTAAGAAALTGTGSATPAIMRVTFSGTGGYPTLTPARVESIGAGCGGAPSGFYELHRHTQTYDLPSPGQVDGLSGLRLIPDVYPAPTRYTVVGGAAAVDLVNGVTGVADNTGDDAAYLATLPGAFDYPGGTTTTIRPCTNGYIWIDPAQTTTGGDFSCTLVEWLGNAAAMARFAPCWHDFHAGRNVVSNPGSGLYTRNIGSVCLVTWNQVGSFDVTTGDNEKHTFQCAIDTATGIVEFRYGTMTTITADTLDDGVLFGNPDFINCITGFTRGQVGGLPSRDPQSRDLSIERPFTTSVEGSTSNMGLTAVSTPAPAPAHYPGRMHRGQAISWNTNNVPAGALLGVLVLDLATSRPGLVGPGLVTAPNCMLSTTTTPLLAQVDWSPGASVTGTYSAVVPSGYNTRLLGYQIVAQYLILDQLITGPDVITQASNALLHTVGLQ
ncbi:MAG: hypothetical protein WAT39_20250 [Planctomycetota bacterium]